MAQVPSGATVGTQIPKVLFLTYKSPLSEHTWRKFEQAAPGYQIEFYNVSRAESFVARSFHPRCTVLGSASMTR